MNISKWFIRSEEIASVKNLYLLNVTSDITNDIETDENNNYWKYCSFDQIRETILIKYRISQDSFVVLYTKDKLMMAARFAWLLHWIGCMHIRILIGQIDPSLISNKLSQSPILPNVPLRPEVRLTCDELLREFRFSTTQFIDVRTYEEYSAEITGYCYVRRGGRIPNFQFDPLDGIYDQINGDITWNELEEYLQLMSRTHLRDKNTQRIVYMCGTGWRASLAAIFAEELNLAKIITVLDSGWFEWSERFLD
jgi:3-mercaptopyruvate sulfurtransferase SseA